MDEIKFAWDHVSHGTAAYLHTNVLLSEGTVTQRALELSEESARGVKLLREIFNIHGVQDAWVDRYKIRVERTQVVEWESISREVEEAVKTYCQAMSLAAPDSTSSSVAPA
jgi:hypothetical protein